MSKSTGNFLSLSGAIDKYSADGKYSYFKHVIPSFKSSKQIDTNVF